MKNYNRLKNKLATGLAMAVGGISLAACGTTKHETKPIIKTPTNTHAPVAIKSMAKEISHLSGNEKISNGFESDHFEVKLPDHKIVELETASYIIANNHNSTATLVQLSI